MVTDFQQSNPAISAKRLKKFETPISPGSVYAVARTVSLSVWGKTCCSECLKMRDDFYEFILIFGNRYLFCVEDQQ